MIRVNFYFYRPVHKQLFNLKKNNSQNVSTQKFDFERRLCRFTDL